MKSSKRIERKYEGEVVLAELLATSGCELTVAEVIEEMVAAVEEGSEPGEIIPLLWEDEPRFRSPEVARRAFSNLLGLWELVRRDAVGDLLMPEQDPALPLRDDFVDQAWRALDELPAKTLRRARDRYENVQAALATFCFEKLRDASPQAQEAAAELAFEIVWLCEHARGPGGVTRATRPALEAAFIDLDSGAPDTEPALGSLVNAALWEQAADEENPLPETDIALVERILRAGRRVVAPR